MAQPGADERPTVDLATVTRGLFDQHPGDAVQHVVPGDLGVAKSRLAQPGRELTEQAEAQRRIVLEEPEEVGGRDRLHDDVVESHH